MAEEKKPEADKNAPKKAAATHVIPRPHTDVEKILPVLK